MFRLFFINKRIIFWPLILTGTTSLASTTNFINRQDHQNLRIVSSKSVKVSQNQYIMRWVKSTQIQYVPIGNQLFGFCKLFKGRIFFPPCPMVPTSWVVVRPCPFPSVPINQWHGPKMSATLWEKADACSIDSTRNYLFDWGRWGPATLDKIWLVGQCGSR